MFLSQLSLDRMHPGTMQLLTDIYSLHQAVMSGFTGYDGKARVLFRVEPEIKDERICILVQSPVPPSWKQLGQSNRGLLHAASKEFPLAMRVGQELRFRLRANPTVKRNGRRYGLIREAALKAWLRNKEEKIGARFGSVLILDEGYAHGWRKVHGKRHKVNVKVCRYEGQVRITDRERFFAAVSEGIGPAKAFGCGLLSLASA